ncbi:MAG: helix-turn-helix domain-containing protein [Nitrospirales bacterium]
MKQQPHMLRVSEVAKRLGVSRYTIYRAIRDGQIPAIRIRDSLRIPEKVLQGILEGEYGPV